MATALYSVYHHCIGYKWKNALLLSNIFAKATLSSSLPPPSGLRVMPAWGHSAQCAYCASTAVPPCGTLDTTAAQAHSKLSLLCSRDGAVRVGSSHHQICLSRTCCEDSRNKAMAGGVFSKWSCQVLEKRNQSQTSLSSTGEDNLSRHDWQDTRFGETPLLWHRHCHTLTPPSPQRGFTETSAHLVLFPIVVNLHTNKQSALK